MPRATRLFDIIQLLRRAEGPLTAQAIAEALEVTKRTIYRDMAALQAMRLPIQGEAGTGYVMRRGYDLPPLMFTQDEVEAIVVGLSLLGRTGDRGLEAAARLAAAKIAEVLPEGSGPTAPLHVSRWTRIPEAGIEARHLRRHIRDHAELRLTYLDGEGRRSQRAVKPLALVYYIDSVLLAAWCELRQAFRHFRIDRIETCAPTGRQFAETAERLLREWEQANPLP